ncbi:hypothetical protein BCR37DRAFT_403132 [Protomyces lactucae-debilis]|uniref:ATP12-domain-containing protein n=1 Tax=Protomyces lactucae-debilis TaxID=2754530 RepID=A0A1Y2F850_PROLT|nr:uncharacterized protein BCR37DRAFT_403132 [Protomyces lactucae-debilis]ORY79817.1 hypothetical protein BCR37DRAFT_403132 [Protomyces lactucae-debilis]
MYSLRPRSLRPVLGLSRASQLHTARCLFASVVDGPQLPVAAATKLAEATLRRFWKKVAIEPSSLGYTVTLDSKPLKTPSGQVLQLPSSKKMLATLIAAEWAQVSSASIRQHQLPLTSLAARAIDHLDHHHRDRAQTAEQLLRYLDTDAVLIHIDGPERLLKMQQDEWTPIRLWGESFFGCKISFLPADAGIVTHRQSTETRQAAKTWLGTLDKWELAAFERSVYVTKSFLLSTLLVESQKQGLLVPTGTQDAADQGRVDVERIASLATLEVRYQTGLWGEVEDTHDVDHVDVRRQLASAVLLIA